MKRDKLPYLDPCAPRIFDRIIATVAAVRREQRSEEFRQAEQRHIDSLKTLRELRALEAREEAKRREEAAALSRIEFYSTMRKA